MAEERDSRRDPGRGDGGALKVRRDPAGLVGVGVEEVLALAAADPHFSAAATRDLDRALEERGLALGPGERRVLGSVDAPTFSGMVDRLRDTARSGGRRAFLGRGVTLATLLGGVLTLSGGCDRRGDSKDQQTSPASPTEEEFLSQVHQQLQASARMPGRRVAPTGIRPGPNIRARAGLKLDVRVLSGEVRREEVLARLSLARPALEELFIHEAEREPSAAGRAQVLLTVSAAGKISEAELTPASTVGAGLARMVALTLRQRGLPRPADSEPATVQITVDFTLR